MCVYIYTSDRNSDVLRTEPDVKLSISENC